MKAAITKRSIGHARTLRARAICSAAQVGVSLRFLATAPQHRNCGC